MKTFIIFGIVSILMFLLIHVNNDYMESKNRKCLIIDKMSEISSGKHHHTNYYLILKEERGIVFDIIVSPSTYSQNKIGSIVYFNLRDFDIKQTSKDNTIYFFGEAIFGACSISFILVGLFCVIAYKYRKR